MGQVLTSKVPVITEKEIKSLHIKLLKNVKPEELANTIFVNNLIEKLTPSNHLKLVLFLNKKAKETGSFEVYPIPKIHREKRELRPAKFYTVLQFLSSLILSGKTQITHIGIDLLLIFQTGVRFLSDHELLEKQLLTRKPTLYLSVNKTKGEATITLPEQTISLLK